MSLENVNINKKNVVPKFAVHAHIIKNIKSENWHYVLEIYPISEDSTLPDPIFLLSQVDFRAYEYAIECSLEIFELLGFNVADKLLIDVYDIRKNPDRYVKILISLEDGEYETLDEQEISPEEYENLLFKDQDNK